MIVSTTRHCFECYIREQPEVQLHLVFPGDTTPLYLCGTCLRHSIAAGTGTRIFSAKTFKTRELARLKFLRWLVVSGRVETGQSSR
jgi:hypothetical protein